MKLKSIVYMVLLLAVAILLTIGGPTAVDAGQRLFSRTVTVHEGGSSARAYSDSCDVAKVYASSCDVSALRYSDACDTSVSRTRTRTRHVRQRRVRAADSCDMQQFSVRVYSSSCGMSQGTAAPAPPAESAAP